MKRGSPLKRKTPVRRSNPERRAASHKRNFDGGIDHDGWVRRLDCVICQKWGSRQETPTQAAHVVARGMGGAHGAWWDIAPLCFKDHREHERLGTKGVLDVYNVDLIETARTMTRRHLEEIGAI